MLKEGGSKTGLCTKHIKKYIVDLEIASSMHKLMNDRYLSDACCGNSKVNGQKLENVQCVFGKNGKTN